jgi:hypothetical protein
MGGCWGREICSKLEHRKKYFTSGSFNPTTSADEFDIHKKANSFRVFVLGESSAVATDARAMGSDSDHGGTERGQEEQFHRSDVTV